MEYLFFDMECADGTHACSFGYVITNSRFVITRDDDILINPHCEFRLGKSPKDPYIKLAYPPKRFYKSKSFGALYEEIKEVLTRPDTIIFGHAVASDYEFLDIACDRYKKPRFDITIYDTQKIYERASGDENVKSLEKIMDESGADVSRLCAHKSRDDAEMSMLTLKYLCETNNVDIFELLSDADIIDRKFMDTAYRKREIRKRLNGIKRKYSDRGARKKIYVKEALESMNIDAVAELIRTIFECGYAFTLECGDCDIYVCENTELGKTQTSAAKTDYSGLSELLGVTVKSDGTIEYTESKAVNSLKAFFGNIGSSSAKSCGAKSNSDKK